jgi:hypothetical protein
LTHFHVIHGLLVSLPFACDALVPAAPIKVADIVVREGMVPDALEAAAIREADFDAAPSAFLLRGGPRSADFLVEGGSRITLRKAPACEMPILFHHLLYPVMAACLRQRGLLVFHASAAVREGNAILVAGSSGAGKSTTIAALMTRGWTVQSDDVSAVRISANGVVQVLPGTRHLHLDDGAADSLALDRDGLVRHDWHRGKMSVPAVRGEVREVAALRRIVILDRTDGPMQAEQVTGHAKLPLLLRALYGPLLPEQLAARSAMIARVLGMVEMLAISRPVLGWTIDAVVDSAVAGLNGPARRSAGASGR